MLKEYKRNGRLAYLDPIRAILVEAKPEERVRQDFLSYLIHQRGIPTDSIVVEHVLSKSGVRSRQRADILILDSNGRPLLVVECKEPGTPLHDGVHAQASGYAEQLRCAYFALTNGGTPEAFHRVGRIWRRLAEFPSLEAMRSHSGIRYRLPKPRTFVPMSLEQLEDLNFLADHDRRLAENWSYSVLGEDTPKHQWSSIYAVYNAIFHRPDTGRSLPLENHGFRVEEFVGFHYSEYGNYAGGKLPGLYAAFRVVDRKGDDQIFKVGFSSAMRTDGHPKLGNRRGTSGIHVAIDDFNDAPHMSLEMCLDTCLTTGSRAFNITHDGKITVGRLGAARRDLLIDYVAERAPYLLHGRSIALGTFPTKAVLAFSDVHEFVFKALHYADLRDRFRKDYKRERVRQRRA